jgi:four helix bundle protein
MMFKFERLDVWKKAVEVYQKVSELTDHINQKEQFSLGEQTRRAALSFRVILLKAQEEKEIGKQNISLTSPKARSMKLLVCSM